MTRFRGTVLAAGVLVALGVGLDVRVRLPLLAAAQGAGAQRDTAHGPAIGTTTPTDATMRNVNFHMAEGVVLHIRSLHAQMHSLKNGVVDFDDATSYDLDVASAEVGMTGEDLTNLMTRHVFAYPGAPLSHLRVEITSDGLRQTGTLHKGVDIPFDMTASVAVTTDGRIQLTTTKVKIFGVNGLVLMKALGLSLEKMMDLSKAHGVTVKGNDLFLDALAILPPPIIHGRLTSVRLSGGELMQTIGTGDSIPVQTIDPAVTNYMLYRGGTLHFAKLFMPDAELLVVDEDQSTPFDFDNPNYKKQLVAGHSKTLPSLGLEVWMPDASKLGEAVAAHARR